MAEFTQEEMCNVKINEHLYKCLHNMTATQIIPLYIHIMKKLHHRSDLSKLKIIKTIKHPLIFFSLDNQNANVRNGTILFDIFQGP